MGKGKLVLINAIYFLTTINTISFFNKHYTI